MPDSATPSDLPQRVLLVGATGTIGRATARALRRHGHHVTAVVRRAPAPGTLPDDVTLRVADVTRADRLDADLFADARYDAVVSCLASRTGAPDDAWRIDHQAHMDLLAAAQRHGVRQFVLLSAICVQKPRLAFQHAKLAFEGALMASGLRWSIVRPTAYFKSLSGQVERVRAGKPFLVFGDGTRTACTPISDDDLGDYLAGCLDDPTRWDRLLPIGGPKPALTAREQGELLCRLAGRPARFTSVPPAFLAVVARVLGLLGTVIPPLRAKAEFARIGHYYATESMLVWDGAAGRYDADATPAYGTETLGAHYERLLRGETRDDRGEHAVF
jgi:divinyl chlorophyllide a 8-vinyl-reductase